MSNMSNFTGESLPNPMDFVQVFDGTQPELDDAERLEAASAFKSTVQDLFLTNIERTSRLNGKVALYPCDYSHLDLTIPQEDGSRLGVDAKSFDTTQATITPYSLSVFERVPYGQPFRHMRYEMTPDGSEVVRHDAVHEPVRFDKPIMKEKPTKLSDSERAVAFQGLANVWEDEFKRRDLERQLGLNDQPVGLEEVQSLAKLINDAKPTF